MAPSKVLLRRHVDCEAKIVASIVQEDQISFRSSCSLTPLLSRVPY